MNTDAKKYFALWLRIRRSPDPRSEISRQRRSYWMMIVAEVLLGGVLMSFLPDFAMLVAGLVLGVTIGAIVVCEQRLRGLAKHWPILDQVIDWEQLEKRLREKYA